MLIAGTESRRGPSSSAVRTLLKCRPACSDSLEFLSDAFQRIDDGDLLRAFRLTFSTPHSVQAAARFSSSIPEL